MPIIMVVPISAPVHQYAQETLITKTLCTNLCVWTDGSKLNFRVASMEELAFKVLELIRHYDLEEHTDQMELLTRVSISDQQFAKIIGRAKMSNHVAVSERYSKPLFPLTDRQINQVVDGYFTDKNIFLTKYFIIEVLFFWLGYNYCF